MKLPTPTQQIAFEEYVQAVQEAGEPLQTLALLTALSHINVRAQPRATAMIDRSAPLHARRPGARY